MKIGVTGAKVVEFNDVWRIIYKEQVVGELKDKGVALAIALDSEELNDRLDKVQEKSPIVVAKPEEAA
ncbi:uncharacterized protein METZ01_LOCUS322826 [marine metagenome]|jgi:hypothetical protein|uniref:Uncharacterized protein n=1 Tax=marine metagenome TaxID=408172 RepID=A0A382PDG1_9ZZZZ